MSDGNEPSGLARRDHPDTSHDAAHGARHAMSAQRRAILCLMNEYRSEGMTAGEVAWQLAVAPGTIAARFVELRGDARRHNNPPYIRRTDERRRAPGGRPGYVHKLTPLGIVTALRIQRGYAA